MNQMQKSTLLTPETQLYLRDAADHAVRVTDSIELYLETVATMTEIYLSSVSETLNRQMKVLAVIATIFIPLTFIAGVYRMNFRYMPELEWKYGYFIVVGAMLALALVMLGYFKKKSWF